MATSVVRAMALPVALLSCITIILVGLLLGTHGSTIRAGCTIAVNGGLPNPQPLILKQSGSNDGFGFHLPSSDGIVSLTAGSQVRLSCSGQSNYFVALGAGQRDIAATCVDATTFEHAGRTYEFREFACQSNPFHATRREGTCYNGNSNVAVGFEVGAEFFKIMDVCFDDDDFNALWSKYDLVSGIGGGQVGFPRPDWVAGSFYPGMNPDTQYGRVTQRDTIAGILGSQAQADKYISQTTDYFLGRGHLTAKADYVYGSQHRATFYFINAAPQWQTFNGANWNTLEDNVRTYASSKAVNLQVYTGTHGITTLPDVNNVERDLYLYFDANNNGGIPVPALFWKVVYNPQTQRGVALVGVNNPYIEYGDLGSKYLLCTDVCSQVAWVKWDAMNQKKGFGYCCDVNELRSKVPSLPNFPVNGLLT